MWKPGRNDSLIIIEDIGKPVFYQLEVKNQPSI